MKEADSRPWCAPHCCLGQGLSKEIIDATIEVHRHLGPGLSARLQTGVWASSPSFRLRNLREIYVQLSDDKERPPRQAATITYKIVQFCLEYFRAN
jgi:hypothetical protein